MTKSILVGNLVEKNKNWWLFKDMKRISEQLGVEIEKVCYYPDIIRNMIIEKYYDGNEVEMEIREELKKLIKDYSFKNKKKC